MGFDRQDALKDYVEVNVRIDKFYLKYPNGRIQTEIMSNENGVVIMKAEVFRDLSDTVASATGHAYEKEGSSYINKTSYIENCETSAVGRALAMLGFEIKKSVASKEEVANAKHQQEQQQKSPQKPQEPPKQAPEQAEEQFPSEAQIKMLSTKLGAAGYLKGDMPIISNVLTQFLGYNVNNLSMVKKGDVTKLAEFLTTHKKK